MLAYECKIYVIIIILIILIILIMLLNTYNNLTNKNKSIKNQAFYDVVDVCSELLQVHRYEQHMLKEILSFKNETNWNDWPEKDLYDKQGTWKIFPFFAFGLWIEENCKTCPTIATFLRSIPKLKLATLSKLSPRMKLTPHQGWGKYSNYVIRCHFGIVVSKQSWIYVLNNDVWNKQHHNTFDWLIFDDSKMHYAENNSDSDRIILMVDVERPQTIRIGESDIGDTKELNEIIKYFSQTTRNI